MDLKSSTKEEIIREMERKSQDSIKIYNPTMSDFEFKWNGYLWHCPAKIKDEGFGMGCMIVPRYIASNYVRKMCDALITKESDKMLNEIKKKYTGTNWAQEEERQALRTNNPTLIEKYTRILWKGKVRDYGMDRPIVEEEKVSGNEKAMHLSIIDKLEAEEMQIVKEAPRAKEQQAILETVDPTPPYDTQG
jgi:hypothetical protein